MRKCEEEGVGKKINTEDNFAGPAKTPTCNRIRKFQSEFSWALETSFLSVVE